MNIKKITVIFSAVVIVLSLFSIKPFPLKPVNLFVVKNQVEGVKAYQIEIYFAGQTVRVGELTLSPRQSLDGRQIMADKSLAELKQWSKSFGRFDFVLGLLDSDMDLVSGWNHFFTSSESNSLSDLSGWDKGYLSLTVRPILTSSQASIVSMQLKPKENALTPTPATLSAGQTPIALAMVRVEILNGCGIKGAADWVGKRIQNTQISVKNGGNAENFFYAVSVLHSNAPISSQLEQALKQLGYLKLSVTKGSVLPDFDVVLIVGKDFRKLKGK